MWSFSNRILHTDDSLRKLGGRSLIFRFTVNIHVCNAMHLFHSATNCDCMCKIYMRSSRWDCANAFYLLDKYRALGDFWLKYLQFLLWHPAFYMCKHTHYKKTKRNGYCTKCGYIAIRFRMLPIQYAHENVTVLAIFIKLRMQFISIACGPIQIHRKSQRTARNIL